MILLLYLWTLIAASLFLPDPVHAQAKLKKVRLGFPTINVAYLPFWAAYHKGFFRDEGIDLEIILMSVPVMNAAILTGDIDYHGGVAGLMGAAVRGSPVKALMFTGDRPLMFLVSRKEISEPKQLIGKKIAGGAPGGTTNLMAERVVREFGLDPKRDVSIVAGGRFDPELFAALDTGVVDAAVLGVPQNIIALEKGYKELLFIGDIVQFPQNGIGSSDKKIRESPDEILKMVRALLRGLVFVAPKENDDEILNIIMKQWNVKNREMAREMLRHVRRFLAKNASVKPEEIKFLIDLARANTKVSREFAVDAVVDYSFVGKALKELGLTP
jgi:NitT/TauT family transport system substrate-binding protein